jgi:hypothetical protein
MTADVHLCVAEVTHYEAEERGLVFNTIIYRVAVPIRQPMYICL